MKNPSAASKFQALHESGCFVLPNPWDRGSAIYLAHLGYRALASTSAGLGFARGVSDRIGALSLECTLANIRELVEATDLPVNADFQEGFAASVEDVFRNVQRCLQTGVAGISIEDASGVEGAPLIDLVLAKEKMQATREAIDLGSEPVVLTGRCESWLVGDPTPLKTAIQRLGAYSEAGADCLYAPGVRKLEEIKILVEAVAPKPLNVVVGSPVPGLSVATLAEVGVRRISIGSAFARVAWGAFTSAARAIQETGEFDPLGQAATFQELNQVFDAYKG